MRAVPCRHARQPDSTHEVDGAPGVALAVGSAYAPHVSTLVRAGALAAVLIAASALAVGPVRRVVVGGATAPAAASATAAASGSLPCPRGTLPDGEVCIPAPAPSGCLTPRACSRSRTP